MKINDIVKDDEYNFLRTHPDLKDNVILLTFGGSYAYGTNVEDSDIDIRGITHNRMEDILGVRNNVFEQFNDKKTDSVLYSLNKMAKLLLSCNPNTIEILGCRPEHYIINDAGQLLLDNKKLFLSKLAIGSFSGYAGQQLNRMLNALARDSLEEKERQEHIVRSMQSSMCSFNKRYADFKNGSINLTVGKSEKEDIDTEILADINLKNYPLSDFNGILNELGNIARVYNKCNHRNHKKDDAHLNKHAMHLVRLYLMGIDILEKEDIITYRENDLDLLMKIRRGYFQKEDHTYRKDFFELIDDLEQRMKYAAQNTSLPAVPDYDKVNELIMEINLQHIQERRNMI